MIYLLADGKCHDREIALAELATGGSVLVMHSAPVAEDLAMLHELGMDQTYENLVRDGVRCRIVDTNVFDGAPCEDARNYYWQCHGRHGRNTPEAALADAEGECE